MLTSKYLLSTLKATPNDAEVISHKLMLRAGMIRQLVASGLYYWLPTGVRVLRKVENIIREEMNRVGAIEIFLPIVQPADLWQESGRWDQYGPELLRFIDGGKRQLVLSPTNEEVMTNMIRNEVNSYKQLPLNLYQIQTKFRDEVRSRFGVIRSREFMMKDGYSFHTDQKSLQKTYDLMYATYSVIFTRIGLTFRVVQADTGSIGGNISHEFQVLADSGEDKIVFSSATDYAANIELAEAMCVTQRAAPKESMRLVKTYHAKTIADLVEQYNIPIEKTVKTLIVRAAKESGHQLVALLIRGDHELNKFKAQKHQLVANPLIFATEEEIRATLKAGPGSLGPVNLPIPAIIDRSVAVMSDFSAGANIDDQHYFGINWKRDLPLPDVYDLRNVVEGDLSPDGKGILKIKRGIEVGHIFQLGTKYSQAMKLTMQNQSCQNKTVTMGCYGIGISRIVAAVIEQNHDHRGIVWPDAITPFQIAILPINMHKSSYVKEVADKIYLDLQVHGIDVIMDDRQERAGVMFADMELIGVPHIVVISDRTLSNQQVEYKCRRNHHKEWIHLRDIVAFLKIKLR